MSRERNMTFDESINYGLQDFPPYLLLLQAFIVKTRNNFVFWQLESW
jgi:hypothetical protein